MFKRFTDKEVRMLVSRLKEEYEGIVKQQRELTEEVKEENRRLRARLSVLEGQRGDVSSALVHAVAEGERIKKEGMELAENERRELRLLADKCRILCDRLAAKYPDEEDCADFQAFTHSLRVYLGEEAEEEPVFDMDEVTNPKSPLDLEKLCRDLGLMEEEA